jgi:predicted Zn-dependent protease
MRIRGMVKQSFGIFFLMTIGVIDVALAENRLPPFLPAYYAPVLWSEGEVFNFISHSETNGLSTYVYATPNQNVALVVEHIEGERPQCDAVFDNILGGINQTIRENKGDFVEITLTEFHATVLLPHIAQTVFVFKLPSSVQVWTFTEAPARPRDRKTEFQRILTYSNRLRYEEALIEGNVTMGRWQEAIRDHAKGLLASGRRGEALIVLKRHLATAPFDYEAHLDFMENATELSSATNSAKTVYKQAENRSQVEKAARFLGIKPRTLDDFPPLTGDETGLRVVLIPLPPCNPWILEDVAKGYEGITGIPVVIRGLGETWTWGEPERIFRQRDIQGALVRAAKHQIDFTGWPRDQYARALADAVKSEDALTKYWTRDLLDQLKSGEGQYDASPRLDRLCSTLKGRRSKDRRVLYVAITESNLYSGDANYLFSLLDRGEGSPVGILAYHMMLGKTLRENHESRRRLVERIAKELVPVSLMQLGIPQSADPTCPHSYASGVERLDEKTLTLSDEVEEALEKIRGGDRR